MSAPAGSGGVQVEDVVMLASAMRQQSSLSDGSGEPSPRPDAPSVDGPAAKQVAGKKGSAQVVNGEFINAVTTQIEELDLANASSQGMKDIMKQRKKQLREVLKFVQDRANSVEDRVTFIQTKYTQLATELIKLEKQHQDMQVQLDVAQREREKAQEGLRRTNMLRDKLEDLCRQLQKDNKEVLEEAKRMKEEEMAARAAMQARLHAAIEDVKTKMDTEAELRAAQAAENESLREKLGNVLSQYDVFNDLVQKKDAESQLLQAKLEHQTALCENLVSRNDQLQSINTQLLDTSKAAAKELELMSELKAQNLALQAVNKDLKTQLDSYFSKFNEFQDTLVKSSQMFDGLKKEIDVGAKLRTALTRERDDANARCEQASVQLAQAKQDNAALDAQVANLKAQVSAVEGVDAEEVKRLKAHRDTLEKLCRTLTAQLKGAKGQADDDCVAAVKAHVGPDSSPCQPEQDNTGKASAPGFGTGLLLSSVVGSD